MRQSFVLQRKKNKTVIRLIYNKTRIIAEGA